MTSSNLCWSRLPCHPLLRTALPCTWWPLGDTQAASRLYVSNNRWGPGGGREDSGVHDLLLCESKVSPKLSAKFDP